jgi:hypothetical protein
MQQVLPEFNLILIPATDGYDDDSNNRPNDNDTVRNSELGATVAPLNTVS